MLILILLSLLLFFLILLLILILLFLTLHRRIKNFVSRQRQRAQREHALLFANHESAGGVELVHLVHAEELLSEADLVGRRLEVLALDAPEGLLVDVRRLLDQVEIDAGG